MKQTLTFIPEDGNYRVKELGWLVSMPIIGRVCNIKNYSTGTGHSAHPNIDNSGSVSGMIKLGYWKDTDLICRERGFTYNYSKIVCSDLLDELCLAIEEKRYKFERKDENLIYSFETDNDYANSKI
jgi:hypothetical protein